MKRLLKRIPLLLIIFLCNIQTVSASSVNVSLNGKQLSFDTEPYIENDRVLVPIRGILESLGYTIQWQEAEKTVRATKNDIDISLPLDSTTVLVNNEPVIIDSPARLQNGRTLVPLRFLAEYSGANVVWDSSSSSVIIHSNEAEGYLAPDSVVYIQTNRLQGSGVVLTTTGLIVTNYHVLEKATMAQLVFNDGSVYKDEVTIIGLDPQNDIALLRINKTGLTPAIPSTTYQIGDMVVALGSPNGIRNTATTGVITGFDQDIISTTAPIAGGSSGGGLFDSYGALIGITSAYSEEQYFSVPITTVLQVPRDLSIPLNEIKKYTYTPSAPENLKYIIEDQYAYVSWSPVYNADHYCVYTSSTIDGTYTKMKHPDSKQNIWYWGFPHSFGISINPHNSYYLRISVVVDGIESPLSEPLKISE